MDPPATTRRRRLKDIPQTPYSPKNRSSGFRAAVSPIEFRMEDGSAGIPLAAVRDGMFTGLLGAEDLVFGSWNELPKKVGYRLQAGLHRSILMTPILMFLLALKPETFCSAV